MLHFPPLLMVAEKLFLGNFQTVYIHTTGVMGVIGLFLAKWMHIPVVYRYPDKEIQNWLSQNDSHKQKIFLWVIRHILSQADEIRCNTIKAMMNAESLGLPTEKLHHPKVSHFSPSHYESAQNALTMNKVEKGTIV
jgi:hypothetical protein